jgi:hypothetical protein
MKAGGRISMRASIAMTLMAVAATALTAQSEIKNYRGVAYDLNSGQLVYSENHREFYESGVHKYSRVSYRDKAGHEFASKVITFYPNKFQPTYELKDSRDGYLEGIKRSGGQAIYYHRRNSKSPLKSKPVKAPPPAVFDGGFDYYVRENLDLICSGKNLSFNFGVPVELDFFRFRVARTASGEVCRMNLELDNVVLRQFVKPIKLWYSTKTRRLLKYEGISNINDEKGKSLKVRVVFSGATN